MPYLDPTLLDSQEISRLVKQLLQALTSFSDNDGRCWPSQEKIAVRMGVSPRSVRTALRLACELKLVRIKRRWKKSNIYTILCLGKSKISTMRKQTSEQNSSNVLFNKNVPHQRSKYRVSPKEVSLCYQDTQEVIGKQVFDRNKSWVRWLIIQAGYDVFQEGLRWLRSNMVLSEAEGAPVNAPGALLTWYLRKQGVSV